MSACVRVLSGEICAFKIYGEEAPFEAVVLNRTSGEGVLQASGPVDCESQKEYTFIIQAYDCGAGPSGADWKKSHKWVNQCFLLFCGCIYIAVNKTELVDHYILGVWCFFLPPQWLSVFCPRLLGVTDINQWSANFSVSNMMNTLSCLFKYGMCTCVHICIVLYIEYGMSLTLMKTMQEIISVWSLMFKWMLSINAFLCKYDVGKVFI